MHSNQRRYVQPIPGLPIMRRVQNNSNYSPIRPPRPLPLRTLADTNQSFMTTAPSDQTQSVVEVNENNDLELKNTINSKLPNYLKLISNSDSLPLLPSQWNKNDYRAIKLQIKDNIIVSYSGPSDGNEKDAATVRANEPIPRSCGIWYFEVTILDRGNKGYISIGFGNNHFKLTRLPGWEPFSWGYHGDDGNFFSQAADGIKFGPDYSSKVGNVIGLGLDFTSNKAFYTFNGSFINYVPDQLPCQSSCNDLYPCVGLRSDNESIEANFGMDDNKPFKFDIESFIKKKKCDILFNEIDNKQVDWKFDKINHTIDFNNLNNNNNNSNDKNRFIYSNKNNLENDLTLPLSELVMDYLIHSSYSKTARSLHQSLVNDNKCDDLPIGHYQNKMEIDDNQYQWLAALDDSASALTGTRNAILAGDIDLALSEIRARWSKILIENNILTFELLLRKFIELVIKATNTKYNDINNINNDNSNDNNETIEDEDDAIEVMKNDQDYEMQLTQSPTPPQIPPLDLPHPDILRSPSPAPHLDPLERALAAGRALQAKYPPSTHPQFQQKMRQAFALVAFDDLESAPIDSRNLLNQSERVRLWETVETCISRE